MFVATRSTRIPGGREYRDTLRHGLRVHSAEGGIGSLADKSFAIAVTDADHGRRYCFAIYKILRGDQPAERGQGVAAGDKLNGRAGSRGTCVFGVENRFAIIAIHIGIGAIRLAGGGSRVNLRQGSRCVSGEAERRPKGSPVRSAVNIRVFDHYDRLPLARNASIE
jgi:hypothetical protein